MTRDYYEKLSEAFDTYEANMQAVRIYEKNVKKYIQKMAVYCQDVEKQLEKFNCEDYEKDKIEYNEFFKQHQLLVAFIEHFYMKYKNLPPICVEMN